VSAALSPDVIKGIDPTGAALTPEQTALVTAIAMIASGGVAGALGENATGAAASAENEALNNATAGDHAANAAKNGALLSSFWGGASSIGSYLGDQLASAGRGASNAASQFVGLMNANSGQTPPSNPDPLMQAMAVIRPLPVCHGHPWHTGVHA
jgi:filamentous hemagglutinin